MCLCERKAQGDASLVTTGAWEGPIFLLSWMLDPRFIPGVDLGVFPLDQEVIQILRCFRILYSRALITQNHEDDNEVNEYLGMHNSTKENLFI